MTHRKHAIILLALLFLIFISGPRFLRAVNFQASLQTPTITAGSNAVVKGTANPGTRISITTGGPAPVPAASGTADAAGNFVIEVGPFQTLGSYGLIVQAGNDRRTLSLEVAAQGAAGDLAQADEKFRGAIEEAMSSLESSLDRLAAQIDRFPQNNAGIARVRSEIPRLRTLFFEVHRTIFVVLRINPLLRSVLETPPLRPDVQADLTRFYYNGGDAIRAGAQEATAASDESHFSPSSDWCERALKAKAAFAVIKTVIERLQGTLAMFLLEKVGSYLGGQVADTAQQVAVREAPQAIRPTTPQQQRAVDIARSAVEVAIPQVLMEGRASPWGAVTEVVDLGINWGLDYFMNKYCLSFSGKMSGHVQIEVAEKPGVPFYGWDVDWEGDVTLTCAKPETAAPVRVWGLISGKAKNFKVSNWLHAIYPKATVVPHTFFTTQPSAWRQASALFGYNLEGTIAGNTLTLKLGSPMVDLLNGISGKLTAIVVPTGAVIPIVQTYPVPFENAGWQLSRTLSREGSALKITLEFVGQNETRRRVKDQVSRTLTNKGAKGKFTMKIDLCAGCPEGWKPSL